jgi:excinuclease ABC subunit C
MSAFDPKAFLKQLTTRPGIYQMYDAENVLLYVGKAKNLKNRVASYFRASGLNTKTILLVSKISDIQVTVTSTETDALLLEHNLIKQHKPYYNILLKDDKSYPYIFVSSEEDFPRIAIHRGAKRKKGHYYGPYPSAGAVRESLHFLQKVFQVRQCEDSYFKNRSRPCLQFQIGRCSGPCVGKVSGADYNLQVERTVLFLNGKSQRLMSDLADDMEEASKGLDFEKAAEYRDQISHLQHVQSDQSIEGVRGDLDIVCAALQAGKACVQVLFVRAGRVLGSKSYFPILQLEITTAEVISGFLPQFYIGSHDLPSEIIVNAMPEDGEVIQQAFSDYAHRKVKLLSQVRSNKARWKKLAAQTAEQNLLARLAERNTSTQRLRELQEVLELDTLPTRMECFDISHSSGEATVASCVVFDNEGPRKSDYRKFNIEGIIGGDDYAAMEQALTRRFKRLKQGEGKSPDILFIDGGKGQVGQATAVLDKLGLTGIEVIGVAKGEGRKAGLETLIMASTDEKINLPSSSPALHLVQHIRDEAHRFAISAHRMQRDKRRKTSVMELIPGVGVKRRRELLRFFGGLQGIQGASVDELKKVPTINAKLALDIYEYFHNT